MDLTKFKKLQEIIAIFGADPVEVELRKALGDEGIDLEHPERVVTGETGIFYIEPSGIITRVLLYIVDKDIGWYHDDIGEQIRKMISQKDFDKPELVEKCHKYHILHCSTQKKAQAEGWSEKYKVAKRLDGSFFYRFLSHQVLLEAVKYQRLDVCGNCLRLLNDITDQQYKKKGFTPDTFFSLNLAFNLELKKGPKVNSDCPPPPNIYPPDWNVISARYKEMKGYQCEGEKCPHRDLSASKLRKYLHCHHVDRGKHNNAFYNLRSLCIYCHAKQPQHGHMLHLKSLNEYLLLIGKKTESSLVL